MANDIRNEIYVNGNELIKEFEVELEIRMAELIKGGMGIEGTDMATLLFFGKKMIDLDVEAETGTKWFWFSQDSPFTRLENMMEFRSAWGPCYKFSAYLAEKLSQLDPKVVVTHEWYDQDDKAHMGEAKFWCEKGKVLFQEGYCDSDLLVAEIGAFDSILQDEDEYEYMLDDGEIDAESKVVFVSDCEKIVRDSLGKCKPAPYTSR